MPIEKPVHTHPLLKDRRGGRLPLAAAASFVLLLFLAPNRPVLHAQPADETVRERIDVTETSILIQLPRLRERSENRLKADDFVVVEGGRRREPIAVEPFDAEATPWTVLIYVDGLLLDHQLLTQSLAALGAHAEGLVGLGDVSVRLATDQSLRWLPPTRDALRLRSSLQQLMKAELTSDLLSQVRREPDPKRAETQFLRARTDALVAAAADTCDRAPCLLLLLSEGFEPEGPEAPAIDDGTPVAESAIVATTGRLLAALGWTVVPVCVVPASSLQQKGPGTIGTDFDAWKTITPGVQMQPSYTTRKGNRFDDQPSEVLDVYIDQRLRTLAMWAATTAGGFIRVEEQIDPELDRVSDRQWLRYRTDLSPFGETRALKVRFADKSSFQTRRKVAVVTGFAPEDEPLRYPHFARAGLPIDLDDVRLRLFLSGGRLGPQLKLRWQITADGEQTLSWPSATDRARVRISSVLELEPVPRAGPMASIPVSEALDGKVLSPGHNALNAPSSDHVWSNPPNPPDAILFEEDSTIARRTRFATLTSATIEPTARDESDQPTPPSVTKAGSSSAGPPSTLVLFLDPRDGELLLVTDLDTGLYGILELPEGDVR